MDTHHVHAVEVAENTQETDSVQDLTNNNETTEHRRT